MRFERSLFSSIANIRVLRQELWANGYRPVAISAELKFPYQKDWPELARLRPPHAVTCITMRMPGTGVLTDGLRPIDGDIDTPHLAKQFHEYVIDTCGEAPMRYREGSCRRLHLFRAEHGEPPKASCRNKLTKNGVEVLGRGNQFFAYGVHPSGQMLQWTQPPHLIRRSDLPVLSERQVQDIIAFASVLIEADRTSYRSLDRSANRAPDRPLRAHRSMSTYEGNAYKWPIGDVEAALAIIPNFGKDWEFWFQIGVATFNATAGSAEGLAAFEDWSGRVCNDDGPRKLWDGLFSVPARRITAGSLTWHARQADPDWDRPSRYGFRRLRCFQTKEVFQP